MYLEQLYLRHFRNYSQAEMTFGPKINRIQGGNAQGKTNLLEAIYFLSTGRSFRTLHLTDLIQQGQSYFYVEAHLVREGIPQVIKASFDGQTRQLQYNDTSYTSFSNLLGLMPCVLYAPEDHALVGGAPAERRRFLDLHLAQIDPLYVHHLVRYFKAMKQRNQLLRQKSEATIETWESIMAHSAVYLIQKRAAAIEDLRKPVAQSMLEISEGTDILDLHYHPTFPLEQMQPDPGAFFCKQFHKWRPREMHLKSTLIGPHRDDLSFTINGLPAKSFSSEGQKRCCLAALRLAEWQRLQGITGVPPLMSVDDFGIHLDEKREHLFKTQLQHLGQVFLSSPDLSTGESHRFVVEKGIIRSFT
jgi:DNA replication and repair protein RecF